MRKIILCGVLAAACLPMASGQQLKFIDPNRITYDGQCFRVNKQDTFIYSGAFHYFRCPQALWPDRFKKIKAAGFNTVETYIPWNYHETDAPANLDDYTKVHLRECQEWIQMAIDQFGLNVIVRPGPYICAEWATGGFPQWLMKYKPADFKGDWLRSDDPTFLAWAKHWYRAVCRALERFQITRRPPGKPGIIMFQLENEYDYAGGTSEAHAAQVKALEQQAYDGGIEVPFVTCWTKQARSSFDGQLSFVMDTCNFYPRYDVGSIAASLAKLKKEQPSAPEMVMELQGGWFSENGGLLAEDQEGINAAQITNLTLYCIQNGVSALNYYMLFGGTTFGDWTPPNITTSYDYFAPIREDGALGEKYRAVSAIGAMLKEYGARLVRSTPTPIEAKTSDPTVEVALRFDTTGARIIFVRNTSTTKAVEGEASFPGMAFHYDLPAFGSKILYVPKDIADANKGTWLPKPVAELPAPPTADAVRVPTAMKRFDDGSGSGDDAELGVPLSSQGYFDAGYVVYRSKFDAAVTADAPISIKSFSNEPAVVRLNGQILSRADSAGDVQVFNATGLLPKENRLEILLENRGYANFGKLDTERGLVSVTIAGVTKPLHFDWTPQTLGVREAWYNRDEFVSDDWASVWLDTAATLPRKATKESTSKVGMPATHLMAWYSMSFALPAQTADEPTRRLLIDATGNGFIYLNGHILGRYWQEGPQREYYVPESWLRYDGKSNRLAVCLRPVDGVEALRAVEISAYPDRRKE